MISNETARWKNEYERVRAERNNFLQELSRLQKELAETQGRVAELSIKNSVLTCENNDLKAALGDTQHEVHVFPKTDPEVPSVGEIIIISESDDDEDVIETTPVKKPLLKRSLSDPPKEESAILDASYMMPKRRKIETVEMDVPSTLADAETGLQSSPTRQIQSTPLPEQHMEPSRPKEDPSWHLKKEEDQSSSPLLQAQDPLPTGSTSSTTIRRSTRNTRPSARSNEDSAPSATSKSNSRTSTSARKKPGASGPAPMPSSSRSSNVSTLNSNSTLEDTWAVAVKDIFKDIPRPPIATSLDTSFHISRKFLYEQYGAGQFKLDATISPDRNPRKPDSLNSDRERYMLFPQNIPNPNLPSAPGEPGIILTKRTDILEHGPTSIFINFREAGAGGNEKGKKSVWQYMGEYNVKKLRELSKEEFQCLPRKTQESWANCMLTSGRPCFSNVLVRIHARKSRALSSIELTEDDLKKSKQTLGTKKTKAKHLSVEEIVEAFVSGQENLDVILLECQEYDKCFAKDMLDHWNRFGNTGLKTETKPSTLPKIKPKQEPNGSSNRTGLRQRKSQVYAESPLISDNSNEDEDEDTDDPGDATFDMSDLSDLD
ncbi:hypothetical protein K435DRAFT_965118 [Dendrothele bispora CBS 962.96]|uniref:DUF6697 domain-containing protein n=1 Tax=Dendrothele bispora (strain CBS 962.96) TaxID=1314807 RepID=A0A4S8M705_DENBC|nr:hypothetical protein K435DRAFT_965118 [Dendrothele bispora CBS 962.96]